VHVFSTTTSEGVPNETTLKSFDLNCFAMVPVSAKLSLQPRVWNETLAKEQGE
jgi:hypothetical protein